MKKECVVLTTLFVFAVVLAGCTPRPFKVEELKVRLYGAPIEVTPEEAASANGKTPKIKLPMRLAFYFAPPTYEDHWKWDGRDMELATSLGANLKDRGVIKEIVIISQEEAGDIQAGGLNALKSAALKRKADALLVVRAASDVVSSLKKRSTALSVGLDPGYDVLFMASAAMWDLKDGSLCFTVETEGKGEAVGHTLRAIGSKNKALKKAMDLGLGKLDSELYGKLASLGR